MHRIQAVYHGNVTQRAPDVTAVSQEVGHWKGAEIAGVASGVSAVGEDRCHMFRRPDFAGYVQFPIPHPQDARVLAALTDRGMRDKMGPDDVGILAIFGHRKAVEAVRTHNIATLKEGFLGIAVASELTGDYRKVCMGLAVLFNRTGEKAPAFKQGMNGPNRCRFPSCPTE